MLSRQILLLTLAASLPFVALGSPASAQPQSQARAAGHYQNFRVAIYVTVDSTRRLADRATFEREFDRAARQTRFDKVYIEAYRAHRFATDDELARVKAWFQEKGVQVSGGVTLAKGGVGGQFGTFDYELPADRAECSDGPAPDHRIGDRPPTGADRWCADGPPATTGASAALR